MGWILMQPADDEESVHATKILLETGKCLFDLIRGGVCLRPTGLGSRCCLPKEKNTTLLWVRLPAVDGLLVKIGVSSRVHISIGYATAKLSKKP